MRRKSRDSPMKLGERYEKIIEHGGDRAIQRSCGSSGNVRLSRLL